MCAWVCVYVCMRHSSFKPFLLIVHCWLMATFQEPSRNVRVSILICIICLPFSCYPLCLGGWKATYLSICIFLSSPTAVSNVYCGGAQSHANIFSFLWPKLSSLSLSLPPSVSLSPSLCLPGRPIQKQKHNDCVQSKPPPPTSYPPLSSSFLFVSQQTERSIAQQPCWWGFHSVWILSLSEE